MALRNACLRFLKSKPSRCIQKRLLSHLPRSVHSRTVSDHHHRDRSFQMPARNIPIKLDDVDVSKKTGGERMQPPKIAEAVLAVIATLPMPSAETDKRSSSPTIVLSSSESTSTPSDPPAASTTADAEQALLVRLQRLINKGHFEDALDAFREVALRGITFEGRLVTATLSILRKNQQVDAALIVLEKCRSSKIKLAEASYTALISLLVESEKFPLALELLEEAFAIHGVSEALLNAGGRRICEAGGLEYTERLIERAKSSGVTPIPATFSAYCSLLTKAGQVDRALAVFRDQASMQRRLTSSFTEPLIKQLSEAKRYDDIFEVLKTLVSWHLTPPKLIFEILLPKAAENGNSEQLLVILQSLRDPARNPKEGPSIWVYNSALIALAKRKDIYWFNKIVKYMRKRNIEFNPLTFAVHLVCLLRCNLQREAEVLQADLGQRKISKEQIIDAYRDAIVLFGRSGRIDYIEDLLDHMNLLSYPPTLETFQVILLVYAKLNMESELLDMLERMIDRWGVVPDTSCVNQLLLLHSFRGNVAEAEDIFRVLKDSEFPSRKPDAFSYSYLISTYGRGGKVREAFATFEEMKRDEKIWTSIFYKVAYDFAVNVLQHNQVLPKESVEAVLKKWNRPPIKSTVALSPSERDELLVDFSLWKQTFERRS